MITIRHYLPTIETINNWIANRRFRQIAGNTLLLLAGTAISQVLLLLTLFLTARYLGVDVYGQYAASFVLLGQAAVILNFGLDTWLLREGARLAQTVSRKVSDALLIKLLIAAPWFVIVAGLATQLNPDVYLPPVIAIAAIGVILQTIGTLAQAAFKSQLRNQTTFWLQIIGNITLLILTLLLIQRGATLLDFIWARTLAWLVLAGVGLYFLIRAFGIQLRLQSLKPVVRQSTSFFLADALGYVYGTADLTIVAIWLGKTAAGLYAPAVTLINAAFIIPNTIHSVVLPVIARAYHENRQAARLPSIMLILGLMLEGAIIAGATFVLARPIILLIFGSDFLESAPILSILSIVLFLKALNFALGTILTAIDRQRDRVVAQAFVAVGNVALNLWVVGRYGLVGVAWVYVFTEFCLVIGYGWFVFKNTRRFTFALS